MSVVIIARNEEQAIGRCVESVLRSVAGRAAEILLVDSASTDRTVEIAREYPIRIARLDPGAQLSPSAGRWLGTRLTCGEHIFFVDGDMVVIESWLAAAFELLSDHRVAAVAGRLFWVSPAEVLHRGRMDDFPLGRVAGLGGSGVYRRQALLECGTFNPFLHGEEERELAYRLSSAGYDVVRIDAPMAYHLDKPRSVAENIDRTVYFKGVGQIMRRHAFRPIFWSMLREQWEVFVFWSLVSALVCATVGAVVTHSERVLIGTLVACLLCLFLLGVWKGFHRLTLYLHERILVGLRFAQGFVAGLRPPDRYPERFTWVQK